MMQPLLSISEVVSGYGAFLAVQKVSLAVAPRSVTALLGSNGAGKSTLLKTIAGLLPAQSGQITLSDADITNLPCYRRVEMGLVLVPEGRLVFPHMSVEDNLRIGAFTPRARGDATGRFEQMFDMFPRLKERRRQLAGTLSGGEQQMLALTRGLMSMPTILLLDEPTLGLAPVAAQAIFEAIEKLKATGLTILLAEQDVRRTLEIADHAYVLETGQLSMEGSGAELIKNVDISKAFLGI